jgi:hypothetical protein
MPLVTSSVETIVINWQRSILPASRIPSYRGSVWPMARLFFDTSIVLRMNSFLSIGTQTEFSLAAS